MLEGSYTGRGGGGGEVGLVEKIYSKKGLFYGSANRTMVIVMFSPDEHWIPASWLWVHDVKPITLLLYAHDRRDDSVPVQLRPVSRIPPAPWLKYAFEYGIDEPYKENNLL